jgi:hypothetical protein
MPQRRNPHHNEPKAIAISATRETGLATLVRNIAFASLAYAGIYWLLQ